MVTSSRKNRKRAPAEVPAPTSPRVSLLPFLNKAISWGLGLLCVLISISFYTGTYDTAFVKLTLFQMGGITLTALWLCSLVLQKRFPLNRQNIVWCLPFVLYFGWNFIGYLWAPYPAEAFDEFFRYVLYFLLTLMIVDCFTQDQPRVLTKCILAAAWISCMYGFMQVLDHWVAGVDIFPWRGFFGARIFSTHANPNFFADFLVFSAWIVGAEYLRSRKKSLLVLAALLVTDLFFTESKGAWLGFAASAGFFTFLYAQSAAWTQKYIRYCTVFAGVVMLGIGLLAGVYAMKRFQSVSFRAYTWASTFEMVQDSPVMGTGVGSFKTIYPAYRKPQIFYLEKIHNNETQHAENEYLEQWATTGTVGLIFFLYMIWFVLYGAWRALKAKEGKLDEQAYWLLGYTAAFFGICVHNAFDVSMRFVSTGLFFAVFAALVVRLSMPAQPVSDSQVPTDGPKWLLWTSRLLLAVGLGWLLWKGFSAFAQISGNVGAQGAGGWLVKMVGWMIFGGVLLGGAWVYLRAAWLSRWARVPLILLLSVWPLQFVYGFFLADHYYGLAAAFSARSSWEGALDFYQKAIEHNPFNVSYYQYRAYVLRSMMDLQRGYMPLKGDKKPATAEKPLNDYERVLRDLSIVRRRAPNNALLYQAYGEFYYSYAVYYTKLSQTAELDYQRKEYEAKAIENMELAKKSFQRSLLTDPVNEATYVYLTSIAMMERNPAAAQAWIDAYRRGPAGVTEPEFLKTHQQSARLAQMQQQLRLPPFSGWWK